MDQKNKKPRFVKIDLENNSELNGKKEGLVEVAETEELEPEVEEIKPVKKKKNKKSSLKKETKKIDLELEEIYKNSDGTMPNMSDFKRKKRNRFLHAIIFLLVACSFLGAVAWAGFFFFQPQSRFSEEDVILSISGEEQVTFGQEVTYRIRYRNAQNIPLSQVNLLVRYPEGFVFEQASKTPDTDKNDEWTLGALSQQDSGYIDVIGRMYGSVGDEQSFRMFLNYVPSNFNSEFQKVNSLNIEIIDSDIEMGVSGPEEMAVGSDGEFIIEIKKPEEVLSNLVLLVESDFGFSKTTSEPKSDEDNNNQWTLDLSQDQTLKITGSFNPNHDTEEASVHFKLAGWKDEKHESDPLILVDKKVKVKLLKTDISANLVINGAMDNLTIQPGDTLNTTISLKNNGSSALKNIEVMLVYETPSYNNLSLLNWTQIKDLADGDITGEQTNPQTRRGYIVWNNNKISSLSELASGDDVMVDLSIPLKTSQQADLTQFTSYLANAVAEIKYEVDGVQRSISTNPINMTVNSDFTFELRDQISENNQNKTVHNITWLLNNTVHEMTNIELSVDVYGDVIWQEEMAEKSAGEFNYDSEKKKLIWKIDKMPVSLDVNSLKFGLLLNSVNSTQTNLTSKISIKAHDSITGQDISLTGNEILLK